QSTVGKGRLHAHRRRAPAAESLSNCRFEEGDASNLDALATLVAQILKTSSAYSPPPPEGFVSPMTWGVESHVEERFGKAGRAAREDLVRPRHASLRI